MSLTSTNAETPKEKADLQKDDLPDEGNNSSSSKHLRRYSRDGNLDEVRKAVLEMGAVVNSSDQRGWTALHLACGQRNRKDIIEFLLSNGADINARTKEKSTPLIVAAFNCKLDNCKLLLEKGADATLMDAENETALSIARAKGKRSIITILEGHLPASCTNESTNKRMREREE